MASTKEQGDQELREVSSTVGDECEDIKSVHLPLLNSNDTAIKIEQLKNSNKMSGNETNLVDIQYAKIRDRNMESNTMDNSDKCFLEREKSEERIEQEFKKTHQTPNSEFNTYGMMILIASFFLRFLIVGIMTSIGLIIRILLDHMPAGKGELNWVGSINTGFMMLVGPLAGTVESRFDARTLAMSGCLLTTIGFLCCSFVNKFPILYVTYGVIGGTGNAFILMAAMVPISMYFKKKRTLANGIANAGGSLGTTILPLFITWLEEKYGWRGMFMILAGVQLNGVVFGMLIRPTYKEIQLQPNLNMLAKRRKSSVVDDTKVVFGNKFFFMFCGASLLTNMVIHTPFFLLPVKSAEAGMTPQEQASVLMVIGIVNMVTRPFMGICLDKVQKYTIFNLGVAMIILMLATLWLPYIYDNALFYVYGIILGLSNGVYLLLQPLAVLDVVQKHVYSMGLGYFRLMICAGVMTGAPIAGWLIDIRGFYDWASYFIGSIGIVGGVLLMVINILINRHKKNKNRKQSEYVIEINKVEMQRLENGIKE